MVKVLEVSVREREMRNRGRNRKEGAQSAMWEKQGE